MLIFRDSVFETAQRFVVGSVTARGAAVNEVLLIFCI